MSKFFLVPYEEVRLYPTLVPDEAELKTPWLELKFRHKLSADAFGDVRESLVSPAKATAKVRRQLHGLLLELQRYPIWYYSPEPGPERLHSQQMLFTIFRRQHLLRLTTNKQTHVDDLATLPADSHLFRWKAAFFLRQNLFMALECESAITAAHALAGPAQELVEEFRQSELGHHVFFETAIRELGFSEEDLPLSPMIKKFMRAFKIAAEANFLAFASMIDFCEIASSAPLNPLAELLERNNQPGAARALARHRELNIRHDHANAAFSFLTGQPAVAEDFAKQAEALTRSASDALVSVSTSAT